MIVVIPMAGRGSRFSDAGFDTPKPLIEVAGKPMILWALESLRGISFDKIIFVALREHNERYRIDKLLRKVNGWATEFVFIDQVTRGQLCTVLKASEYFDDKGDVLIAASDSYIKSDIGSDISARRNLCSGLISVISLPGDQWSFARADDNGRVVEVAEKKRISDHCSTGLYYFSRSSYLQSFGQHIIMNNETTRNEFYVIPVYQKMIEEGLTIELSSAAEMWDMGTPAAKQTFETYRLKENG
jgi:UDP-N-acetylglucosamine diphosphorylase / glucose-1-phosphate thymidylyltransferase / UDP-N-acetylgalactosamine diphosphorylase / glucosamine-1-phosphate N-acetyltransferase / galactosamine-1-phosphate N-acetyltransferase